MTRLRSRLRRAAGDWSGLVSVRRRVREALGAQPMFLPIMAVILGILIWL